MSRLIKTVKIHAGHTSSKGKAQGAVGLVNESDETRVILKTVIKELKKDGVKVYNCTQEGEDVNDNLYRIVKKSNSIDADIDVSLHLNCGRNDKKGDKKTGGVECWLYDLNRSLKYSVASDICRRVSNLGFTNRGLKESKSLYVLRETNTPTVLVEGFFIDDKDDVDLYKKNKVEFAKRIAWGIVGHRIYKKPTLPVDKNSNKNSIKWVQQHLSECGIVCTVSGYWSEDTADAVRAYRRRLGWNQGKGKKATLAMIKALSNYRLF